MNEVKTIFWRRGLWLALWLCLACGVRAQPAGATQPIQPVFPGETTSLPDTNNPYGTPPELTNELSAESSFTNQPQASTEQPAAFGPRTGLGSELGSPIAGTSVVGTPPGAGVMGAPTGAPLARWGPVDLHATIFYSLVYGNGIEAEPGEQAKTFINTISPGISLALGSHWTVNYSPSYMMYSSPAFRNTLAESALLNGHTTYEDWTFTLSQSYNYSALPLIETGAQTTQEDYATTLGANYQMSGQLSLRMTANQDFRIAPEFNNVDAWTGSVSLNAQLMRQFGAALVFTGGYNDVSVGSSMPFEEVQGKINFTPGSKLTVALSGGAEETQFVNPSAPSLLSPVFAASLGYQPWRGTSLSLTASRTVAPSFYANSLEVNTGVNGALRQELTKKLSLTLSAGYMTEPLTSIEAAPLPKFFFGAPPLQTLTVIENNSYTTFAAALSYAVITRGTVAVFYNVSDNSSGQANFKYSSTQVGLSASYHY